MAWMQKLAETYDSCKGREPDGAEPLMPIAHTVQNAHIEITIDGDGNFCGAQVVAKELTILPATEASANRTSGEAPHPLADKIQYCAGDYADAGGCKEPYFASYEMQLAEWAASPYSHPKARAVLAYVRKRSVVADLLRVGVLHARDGKLLREWLSSEEVPPIFRFLPPKDEDGRKVREQGDAFVRWRVEISGTLNAKSWEDDSLAQAWIGYYAGIQAKRGLCMVGGAVTTLAEQHPARLRHSGDKAKLISSNDGSGFTYRGRFHDPDQATAVGFEISQKAHTVLAWLIRQQVSRQAAQTVVAWAVGGSKVPAPYVDTLDLLSMLKIGIENSTDAYTGQAEAILLGRAMAGYRALLPPAEDVVVMAMDSATPGRMAVTYYRELKGSEFLDRIEGWHRRCSWWQRLGLAEGADGSKAARRFVGAPAPRDIAEASHGRHLDRDGKLLRATIDRLLPCIVDAAPIPRDLVQAAVRRTCGRAGLKRGKNRGEWEFEKCLGVACGLYRGTHEREGYRMALEEDRRTKDYLYGRLLAVAERIETIALMVAKESRDTSAAKLMQRFADRPYTTWRVIETQLVPYKSRLRANRLPFLLKMEKLLDGIMADFDPAEFRKDHALSGEFLLGYHCQRQAFRPDDATDHTETDDQGN